MEEPLVEASAPVTEPAETQEAPVTDSAPIEGAVETEEVATEETKEEESTEASSEVSEDDDPFAEFDNTVKSKAHYEELFKTEKWKHVPHAARDEIRNLADAKEAVESRITELGGEPMLATIKPVTEVLSTPNPTPDQVEAAFDAIDQHNPKVMEQLGAGFTKKWVHEVVADPVQHLGPIMQHVFGQTLGAQASKYDLMSVLELIELSLAQDREGDPIIDLDAARRIFEANGGHSVFKHQQDLAARDAKIAELQNGYQQPAQQNSQVQTAPEFDVDGDLEKEMIPKVEGLLTKLGYKADDPEFSLFTDAVKFRLRHAPEAETIRGFAKTGAYKTPVGDYVQGVQNNREYLKGKIQAQLINELKVVQARRKATSISATPKIEKPVEQKKEVPVEQPKQPLPRTEFNRSTSSREDFIASITDKFKQQRSDDRASAALAQGK